MELKLEHISQGRQSLSPGGERTLSMRDLRVTAIANLGATRDGYDCLDLSNNEIRKLDNFPLLPRLRTLVVAGNRISKISRDLGTSLPNLTSLVLTGNSITHLRDLSPLFALSKLERLSLLDNPVTAVPNFRLSMVLRLPSLRFLNFCKVTKKERDSAVSFFRTEEGLSLLREQGYELPTSDSLGFDGYSPATMVEKTIDVNALPEVDKGIMGSVSELPSAV
ncbi:putative U2 small nuclear ribonucleoprotein A' [Babesia sp. Xinjiang]|uniref:putative U2 small nuclear ribonucleoprotein A' n=1 Tax=Babesia sp. Xinjiang TaxID=462227 RepID=UPI000A261178|nr:putative U2 small nuclear ribonucleoprotein A' [Babesia sp. Xinjiang]ORM39812.1 putative U2 small nuclear ribonucleoprotein A' [Babesia sp. Xinjiang]